MTPGFRYSLLWIVGSLVLVVAALTMISAGFVDGQYVPSNPDAFYHARRILDAVMTGAPIAQFDPRIHVPEGSWIAWPYGFDALLAAIVKLAGPFADEAAAAAVLFHLPVAAAPIAVALVVVLARQLKLTFLASTLLALAFAALPLVFLAFAVGNVDHHFAELLWLSMSLCAGIAFFRSGASPWPAVVLGLVLGTANGITNGLFILQLPVLATFAWRWSRGETMPARKHVYALAGVLLGVTLAVCAGSEPWRRGFFEFYTLSWFHAYVAAGTALMLCLLATLKPSLRTGVVVAVAAAAAAVPLLGNLGLGSGFVSGELDVTAGVTEVMSPYRLYALFGPAQSTRLFSWLMWLAPVALVANGYWAFRRSEPGVQFFAIAAVFFLALLGLQFRFGVLGAVPLLATLALGLDAVAARWPADAQALRAGGALALLAALVVPTRAVWTAPRPPGGDPFYADLRPALMTLHDACTQHPAVVLAAIDDGHWVRYHTQCSVIGNVFLLTSQHAEKRREVERLFDTEAASLLATRPDIGYVLVHATLELFVPVNERGEHGRGIIRVRRNGLPQLTRALLGPSDALPPGYRVLWELVTPEGEPFGRLLELERGAR